MKFNLTIRLFIAFLGTAIFAVFAMAVAFRISFQQGFLDYVMRNDVEALSELVVALSTLYDDQGNWDNLGLNHRAWRQFVRHNYRHRNTGPGRQRHFRHMDSMGDGPPRSAIIPRLSLFNHNNEYIAGNSNPQQDAVKIPIFHRDETVGWISVDPPLALTNMVDINFQKQQFNTALLIGVVCIFLSAAIAILFARYLSLPIKHLATATRQLTAGKFQTRIDVSQAHNDEVGRLQMDFNRLAKTLEKNEQARRQWIADISHELRTPVAVLRGEVEAIEDGVRNANSENLHSIHSEVMRLNQIIEDLYQLSLSDIGALNYRKQAVGLVQLVDDALQVFDPQFQQHPITLKFDPAECDSVTVFADEQRLHQLFNNLIQNTLRYTKSQGTLEIWCEKSESEVSLNWRDSEPGVTDQELGHLFDRFFRKEESRNRKYGGAGLGLAIVKNIVEAHDGEISVRHSPSGGLWFRIILPIQN